MMMRIVLIIIIVISSSTFGLESLWQSWWTYEEISGSQYWGKTNTQWRVCSNGKFQSPIDINTSHLLFDPNLEPFYMRSKKVSGNITNTGRGVTIDIEDGPIIDSGPLKYKHKLSQIKVHFGGGRGSSEHSVNGQKFPSEVHLITYNTDLYHNLSQAIDSFRGIAIIAVFSRYGMPVNEAFDLMSNYTKLVRLKGQSTTISGIPLDILLPRTSQYITYQGSLTQPGCYETVTWIILNRPIYIQEEQLNRFRRLRKGRMGEPEAYLEHNTRPEMPSFNRLVQTNINFYKKWEFGMFNMPSMQLQYYVTVGQNGFRKWNISECTNIQQLHMNVITIL